MYGDGSQSRSFCYVDDLLDGLLALASAVERPSHPVNLGNPNEMTIGEVAMEVRRLCQSNSEIVLLPLPEDDPRQRCPDVSQARNLLGWEPRTPFQEGLELTIDYFRTVL